MKQGRKEEAYKPCNRSTEHYIYESRPPVCGENAAVEAEDRELDQTYRKYVPKLENEEQLGPIMR